MSSAMAAAATGRVWGAAITAHLNVACTVRQDVTQPGACSHSREADEGRTESQSALMYSTHTHTHRVTMDEEFQKQL